MTPRDVSALITFQGSDRAWKYKSGVNGMPEKQAEGVAYLWNLLSKHRVAILADEVGMGKTYQAIGLLCLLWMQKPSARVLVMTPNREICTHWELEYETFKKNHWRPSMPGANAQPCPDEFPGITFCEDLPTLGGRVVADGAGENGKHGRFYLATIHSLSRLALSDDGDHRELAVGRARAVRESIQRSFDGGLDLVIVDEAHYFRRSDGDSQRAHAARAFFGPPNARLAKHALLMTATPSHSGIDDVSNILGYFVDTEGTSPADLLKRHALRRLRLLKGVGGRYYNKHHYREEVELPAGFEGNPESELFFALYQRKLVTELQQKQLGRRLFYGYLEGFESTGIETDRNTSTASVSKSSTADAEGTKIAFNEAPDTRMLRELSKSFYAATNKHPEHPKYDALVTDIVNKQLFQPPGSQELHDDKHLVFVRRIPSVRQIARRVNDAYDEVLARRILSAWGVGQNDPSVKRWKASRWSRGVFEKLVAARESSGVQDDPTKIEDGDPITGDADDEALGSRVMNLFVTRKDGAHTPRTTDCSRVRLRFSKPDSVFSLFLEPARDYCAEGYTYYYKGADKTGERADYAKAARDSRRPFVRAGAMREQEMMPYTREMATSWGLMYAKLSPAERQKLSMWKEQNVAILENFANYLKAGFLFASPVMVELYCWFTEFRRRWEGHDRASAQLRYRRFVKFVSPKLDDSLMLRYFKDALSTFDRLCEKLIKQKLASETEDWAKLQSQHSPAWFASGQSSNRDRLILGFNSPFFPNVLVATSVFQEGVNLHLHCRQVHHYGIAWTPGDNEQRVGRLDRLFGRVNMELEQKGTTRLRIQYPYLAETFDQDQLASFLQKKHAVEKEMDACLQGNFDKAIEIGAVSADWKQYLRKARPIMDKELEDPYPPKF